MYHIMKRALAALNRQPRRRTSSTGRKNSRRVSLSVETLESRLVPSGSTLLPSGPLPSGPLPPLPETTYFRVTGAPSQVTAGTSFAITVTEYSYATGRIVSSGGASSAVLNFDVGGTATPLNQTVALSGGRGTATITLTTAETGEIFATSGSLRNLKTYVTGATAPITVAPGPAAQFIVSTAGTEQVGKSFPISVTAEDRYNNVVSTYNQTPTFSATDGYPVALSGMTWSKGVGTATVTLNNPGITKLKAAVGAVTGTSGVITVDAPTAKGSVWSGYVVSPAVGTTAVGGSWIQPAVSGSNGSKVSMWVGIDGWKGSTVEQIGTAATMVNGTAQYVAWYELFGDQSPTTGAKGPDYSQVNIPNFTVRPGDSISAEVSLVPGTSRTFLFQITDTPKGGGPVETFSIQQTMKYVTPARSTAEWIVENPNKGKQPLANFGQVTFTGAWATIGGTTGAINSFPNAQAVNLSTSQGNATTSDPPLLARTLGFNEPGAGVSSSSFTVTYSQPASTKSASAGTTPKNRAALVDALFEAYRSSEQDLALIGSDLPELLLARDRWPS
jgi:hypothetical protein